jgi:hypothetical protein
LYYESEKEVLVKRFLKWLLRSRRRLLHHQDKIRKQKNKNLIKPWAVRIKGKNYTTSLQFPGIQKVFMFFQFQAAVIFLEVICSGLIN